MGFTFRVVDINDVIFNLLGTILGYIGFKLFKILFNWFTAKSNIELNSFLKYISNLS